MLLVDLTDKLSVEVKDCCSMVHDTCLIIFDDKVLEAHLHVHPLELEGRRAFMLECQHERAWLVSWEHLDYFLDRVGWNPRIEAVQQKNIKFVFRPRPALALTVKVTCGYFDSVGPTNVYFEIEIERLRDDDDGDW